MMFATAAILLNIATWVFAIGWVTGWSHRPSVAGK
jgi:hypothetical protein